MDHLLSKEKDVRKARSKKVKISVWF